MEIWAGQKKGVDLAPCIVDQKCVKNEHPTDEEPLKSNELT